jgi:hypothetical protein
MPLHSSFATYELPVTILEKEWTLDGRLRAQASRFANSSAGSDGAEGLWVVDNRDLAGLAGRH